MQKIRLMNFKGVLKKFSNKYVIVTLIFAAVILFIDPNNVFKQVETNRKMRKGKQELKDLTEKTDEIIQEKERLENDTVSIEELAREVHGMQRENEVRYIIEKK